jgi:hypothetical protein
VRLVQTVRIVLVKGSATGSSGAGRNRIAALLAVGVGLAVGGGSFAGAADAAIFWANASGNTIGAAELDGTHINERFITGAKGPSDVTVYGSHIYWANAEGCTEDGSCPGTIGEADLNGTHVNESFVPADTPYGVTVDGQYIYWSNFGTNTLGRANVDGGEVNQSFITGANGPDGVVVDGEHIYWANANSNTIGEANLNGTAVDQSFITGPSTPEGMAIDSRYIYWANHSSSSIGRASLAGTEADERFVTGAGNYPTRVAVDSQHVYWTTWAENSVPSVGTIGEANLAGGEVNDELISGANSPVGVAVSAEGLSGALTARCLVPNVRGKKLAQAKKAIVGAHCALGRVKSSRSKRVRKGSVISQGTPAGRSLAAGSKVNLVLSTG